MCQLASFAAIVMVHGAGYPLAARKKVAFFAFSCALTWAKIFLALYRSSFENLYAVMFFFIAMLSKLC